MATIIQQPAGFTGNLTFGSVAHGVSAVTDACRHNPPRPRSAVTLGFGRSEKSWLSRSREGQSLGVRINMTTYDTHYANHLAPVYVWMAGGIEAALEAGTQDIASLLPGQGLAVDLGAGFGMHSIPLARGGYEVLAIDTTASLLAILRTHRANLPIETREEDLRAFKHFLPEPASVILCMGDTLTHLESFAQVERLCEDVSCSLKAGGRFVATFRDYRSLAKDDSRFIPVRSDSDRILTCFLEEEPTHIKVYDILHERVGSEWKLTVSSYRKLRLSPPDVERKLATLGLSVRVTAGPRGMVRVEARA